jgi:uncharacterized membrane protein
VVLYSIVPWVGVIAAGYAFGAVLMLEPERRQRICLAIGLSSMRVRDLRGLICMAIRSRGDQVLTSLNATKYPASLSFLT